MKIYTMTLNPAYDVHAWADCFEPFHENLAQIRSRDAGGKGVNISRALRKNLVDNTAVVVVGKENGAEFKQGLADAGIHCLFMEKEGRIRENLTLHCGNGPETRISFSGFSVDDSILDEILPMLQVDGETVITFTGRVAAGMDMGAVKAFLRKLSAQGARIVLDSRSFSLADMYEVSPWLVKPNQEEISAYFGCPVESIADSVEKAKEMAEHGITNVMISLGAQGALLLCGGRLYIAQPPRVEAVSTIGAGDSSIAGFVAAAMQGKSAAQCLRTAVSYGTAACLTHGSMPPEKADVDRIYEQVTVTEVTL